MVSRPKKTIEKIKRTRLLRYQQNPPQYNEMPKEMTPREELEMRLQNSYFIVAGGAWQHLWDRDKAKAMGFGGREEPALDLPTQDDLRSSIRPELLKRFRNAVTIMPAMTARDYEISINEFTPRLPSKYRAPFKKLAKAGIDQAVSQKLGMRFFEEILSSVLTSPLLSEEKEKSENLNPDPF